MSILLPVEMSNNFVSVTLQIWQETVFYNIEELQIFVLNIFVCVVLRYTRFSYCLISFTNTSR